MPVPSTTTMTTAFGILEAIQRQATEAVFVRGRMEPILWPIRGADDWYSFACHVQNHPTSIEEDRKHVEHPVTYHGRSDRDKEIYAAIFRKYERAYAKLLKLLSRPC